MIDCPCKPDDDEPKKHKKEVLTLSSLDKRSKWYCSDDQCDMTVTKCIDVPSKGEVCWDVECPPCMTPKDEGIAATNTDEESKKKKKDDDKKKFGCLPEECDQVKEACITVPVAGDICWNVTCPACNATKPDEPKEVLTLSSLDKDSKWYCADDQCGMNVTKCIDVPFKGEVCWDVTCPPCMTPKDEGIAATINDDEVSKKKKDDDKKKFGCLPEDCDTTKEVCIDVPFKGEVCWDVKCPACKAPEEAQVMDVSVYFEKKGKKGDDKKKFGCLPKECGTTKEVCMDIPVKGKVCWDVKCPACKAPEEAQVMVMDPVSVVEKKGDGKKKFGCLPKECGTTKEVCIDVPVKGKVCWDVKCPACKAPDEAQVEVMDPVSVVEKKGKKGDDKKKFGCLPKECGMTKEVCMDIPVKGKVCWDVKCPACKAPEEAQVMVMDPVSVVEKKGDDKKKFGCLPKECGTTKEVCMDIPVKGKVCWDVKCPACKAPEEAQVMVMDPVSVVEKKGDGKKKFGCLPKECGMTKEVCIDVPVKGKVCWDVKCPACKAPEEAQVMVMDPVSVVEKKGKKGDDKKKFGCLPKECGTTKEVCMDIPVKGKVCWDVKCPACADETTDAVIYA